ncbi:MAG TPA: hypothetical protein VFM00_08950, partial [Candidatus Eisenbacteria bacterium]|nr:hypothetical protein [Candidatus Eisenbacteria bacterium]
MVPHAGSGRIAKFLLIVVAALALAMALATLLGGPRRVAAQDADGTEEVRIGLPSYVVTDPPGRERIMYADSSVSVNVICPVRKARVDPNRNPVYVNGKAI